jgi:hypothetical protein
MVYGRKVNRLSVEPARQSYVPTPYTPRAGDVLQLSFWTRVELFSMLSTEEWLVDVYRRSRLRPWRFVWKPWISSIVIPPRLPENWRVVERGAEE